MDNLFFSILIPNYGHNKYIDVCLDSVVNQITDLNFNYEIIFCDQSNDDDFTKNLFYLKNKYNRKINFFRLKNQSLLNARVALLEKAKGKYICYVDSDDFVDNDYLLTLFNSLKSNYFPDVLITSLNRCDAFGQNVTPILNPSQMNNENIIDHFLYSNYLNSLCRKIFKKELYTGFNFKKTDISYGEDWLISFPIMFNARKIILNGDISKYYYRSNPNSLTKSISYNNSIDQLNYRKEILKQFPITKSEQSSLFLKYSIETMQNVFINLFYLNEIKYKKFKEIFSEERKYIFNSDSFRNTVLLNRKQKMVFNILKTKLYIFMFLLFKIRTNTKYKKAKNKKI